MSDPHESGHRAEKIDWRAMATELDALGWAVVPHLLSGEACDTIAGWYDGGAAFRSEVIMARHGFGRGAYKYFAYPLPPLVEELRTSLYPHLAPLANRLHERMGIEIRFPADHAAFLARCHAAGQTRPTPLLLRYGKDDYNCLHQDLYGEHVFPLQMAVLLDQPGLDFEGGEFVLVEQRPRQLSRPHVVPLRQGEGVIFAVRERPAEGARGLHRRALRHGVSEVRSGRRRTLGIILH